MNKTIIWVIVIVVIIVGWYFLRGDGESTTPIDTAVTVTLAEQNTSGMSGKATLTDSNEGLMVALSLTGAPEDVEQPAHIHINSCADIGGVEYPLNSPVNGESATVLTGVTLDMLRGQLPLSLNVHKSAEEVGIYVACGDILIP